MKIKNTHLLALRNDEHFQFMQFVIALVGEVGAAALKVVAQLAALTALHAQEDEALKKITKSALTAKINEADRARDGVFRGLVDAVRSFLNHYNPAAREAATRLMIVLDTYGNVAAKSHVEETSALYNLLKDLSTTYAEDVQAMSLTGWLTELDRLNKAVEELLEGRADEGAGRTSLILKEVRAQVDEAYATLAAMVSAQALVASVGSDTAAVAMYADFTRRLNERIDMMNDALAIRRGMAKAKKEKEEAEKPQPKE